MIPPCRLALLVAIFLWAPSTPGQEQPALVVPTKSLPAVPADLTWRESIPGGGGMMTIRRGSVPVERSFPASGIATVILRAAEADRAEVVTGAPGSPIRVVGLPEGNEVGYHPADPNQERVGSPYRLGLDFVARPFGSTLVVSTKNESRFIHHEYHLVHLQVRVPPGVTVVPQARPIPPEPRGENSHLEAP